MRLLLVISFLIPSLQLWAKEIQIFKNKELSLTVLHETPGEPVSAPQRVSVYLYCGKVKQALLDDERVCKYVSHQVLAEKNELILKVKYFDSVKNKCGEEESMTFSFADKCLQ